MSLKFAISSSDYDSLSESIQELYEKKGDKYQLRVDGIPEPEDTSGLKQKIDELLSESKTAKQKARDAEEKAKREAEERAKQENDFKSLYESSEAERAKALKELEDVRSSIAREKQDNAAMKIAAELADGTNAELLAEFVKRRIRYEDGQVRVLDANGNPTVSTTDDLKKEFATSGRFDALLRGSKSGGGGATPSKGGGAAKKLSEMSDSERVELYRTDPDKFRQLRESEGL